MNTMYCDLAAVEIHCMEVEAAVSRIHCTHSLGLAGNDFICWCNTILITLPASCGLADLCCGNSHHRLCQTDM